MNKRNNLHQFYIPRECYVHRFFFFTPDNWFAIIDIYLNKISIFLPENLTLVWYAFFYRRCGK